jgi:hypothetical protein
MTDLKEAIPIVTDEFTNAKLVPYAYIEKQVNNIYPDVTIVRTDMSNAPYTAFQMQTDDGRKLNIKTLSRVENEISLPGVHPDGVEATIARMIEEIQLKRIKHKEKGGQLKHTQNRLGYSIVNRIEKDGMIRQTLYCGYAY